MKKRVIKITGIVIVLIIFGYGVFMLTSSLKYKNEKLSSYRYSSGGDMNGSYYSESIYQNNNNETILTIEHSYMHNEDSHIEEYKITEKCLEEIEKLFKKFNMQNWQGRKFSNMFVCDGATHRYAFTFESGDDVSFSSQIFGSLYRSKLNKIDEVVSRYRESGIKLPGLIIDDYSKYRYPDQQVSVDIYQYCNNTLSLRLTNQTDDSVEIPLTYNLLNEQNEVIASGEIKAYDNQLEANETFEEDIELNKSLEVGDYTFEYGTYSCTFKISLTIEDGN